MTGQHSLCTYSELDASLPQGTMHTHILTPRGNIAYSITGMFLEVGKTPSKNPEETSEDTENIHRNSTYDSAWRRHHGAT